MDRLETIGFNDNMKLTLPLLIGLRYIRSKRRTRFISFVSSFSLLGMLLGSTALVAVLSVMNGFDREIKQRLLQVIPHATVTAETPLSDWSTLQSQLQKQDGIVYAAPYIGGNAMVSYERGLKGVSLRGVRPSDLKQLSQIDQHMILGDVEALEQQRYGIIVGGLLARYLGLNVGDKLSITLPQLSITPLGAFPRVKRFTVVGVFEVGAQVDQNLVITHFRDAQALFRMGERVSGLELRTDDLFEAPAITRRLAAGLNRGNELIFTSWDKSQGSLFSAVKMEKNVVSVLLLIIIAIAAFNIVSSLVLMVADKRADIAVLRTLGLSRFQVMGIFVVQGGALGIIGVLIGSGLGALIAVYIDPLIQTAESLLNLKIFDPNVYFISKMPSVLKLEDITLVIVSGCLLSLAATLFPAYQASKIEPAEALRYE